MTDREYDLWKAVFLADYERYDADKASSLADAALVELRKRMAPPEPELVLESTDPLRLYPWAIDTDGDGGIRDRRRNQEAIVMASEDHPGKWRSWRTPSSDVDGILSDTRDGAIACVDWQQWNMAPEGKRS